MYIDNSVAGDNLPPGGGEENYYSIFYVDPGTSADCLATTAPNDGHLLVTPGDLTPVTEGVASGGIHSRSRRMMGV